MPRLPARQFLSTHSLPGWPQQLRSSRWLVAAQELESSFADFLVATIGSRTESGTAEIWTGTVWDAGTGATGGNWTLYTKHTSTQLAIILILQKCVAQSTCYNRRQFNIHKTCMAIQYVLSCVVLFISLQICKVNFFVKIIWVLVQPLLPVIPLRNLSTGDIA